MLSSCLIQEVKRRGKISLSRVSGQLSFSINILNVNYLLIQVCY